MTNLIVARRLEAAKLLRMKPALQTALKPVRCLSGFARSPAREGLLLCLMLALASCGGGQTPETGPEARQRAESSGSELPSFLPTSDAPPSAETVALQAQGARLNAAELEKIQATGERPRIFRGKSLSGFADKAAAVRVPVFRFYNTRTGAHFYTTSEAERDQVMANLPFMAFEGIAFHASGTDAPGLSPVHRFYNTLTGVHFYTISEAERAHVAATLRQFTYEGVAYHASPVPGTGFDPLFRFYLSRTGVHFYTNSVAERDRIVSTLPQYTYEGVGYYVPNADWPVPNPITSLPPPPAPIPLPPDVQLADLGSARTLIANPQTLTQLRNMLATNAPAAVKFKTMVDRQVSGEYDHYGFENWNAALMARIVQNETASNLYCDYAVDKTEAFVASEEATARAYGRGTGSSDPRPEVAYDSYLYVGEHIGGLSMVYDWCRSRMTNAQRARWRDYANQSVWNVWNHTQAKWAGRAAPWSGWSVDNPINNYYSSFLEATMLLGLATYGENEWANHWLNHFRITKLANQAFPQYRTELVGGGSQEGTGYGTAMRRLWRIYDWWERSTGQRIADQSPNTLLSLAHTMHSIVPTLDRLAPTGDHARDSSAALFDYHRDYLLTLMRLFPTDPLSGAAKTLLANSTIPEIAPGRFFMFYSDYLNDVSAVTARPLSSLNTAYWGSGTGQFSVRSAWTPDAGYANFICGPYTESHAHRDQGSFVLYKGTWLAYDSNIDGLSGLEQAEAMHNLVRFESGGQVVPQSPVASPCVMRALNNTASHAYAFADTTPVYRSPSPVTRQERAFLFIKPSTWVVYDRAQTSNDTFRHIWTLNLPEPPTVTASGLDLNTGGHQLKVTRLLPAGAAVATQRWIDASPQDHYRHNYGYSPDTTADDSTATRVDVTAPVSSTSNFLHVLGADGAVNSAILETEAGQVGARIALSDGRTATVRFNTTGVGGRITIRDASDNIVEDSPLPTSVQPLSLMQP
jgi:hypothetical protein